MSKTRVYQIANELKMSNEDVLAKLKELEINAVDKDSELEEDEVELVLEILKDEIAAANGNTIAIDGKLTVQELATKLDKSASEIIMKLMKMGTMATINQEISFEIGSLVASEYGFELVEGSANDEEELEGGDTRTVLHFHPALAPVKVGILPLSKKLNEGAEKVYAELSKYYNCEFDDRGNIGKRYRRQDEIGTPFCVTYDFDSETDNCVTVRDRDTMEQERVKIEELLNWFDGKFEI